MFSPAFFISVVLSTLYLALVLYFLVGWLRLKKHESSTGNEKNLPFVSIIIPVRNESENIQICLKSIFSQNYPAHLFEVIVIDDYSTDPTIRLAKEIAEKNLTVLDLQNYLGKPGEYMPNKKKAIALGIKNARGELIITTDGDCIAATGWLRAMVDYYTQHNYKLVTGPVFMKPAVMPVEIFQQLDVISLSGITGATIRNGFPTMCNGANLMYAKSTFIEIEGFKGNHDVPTGDDIFLMQKIDVRYDDAIGYVKNRDACVYTRPEKSLSGFIAQRVRWISKSTQFGSNRSAWVLYFAYVFNLFVVISAASAFQPLEFAWLPLAIAAGTKFFADLIFNLPLIFFFRKYTLLLVFPVVEVLHVIYVTVIGVLSLTGKYRWKDRKVG